MTRSADVTIIGGGAAAALLLTHLQLQAAGPLEVAIIDRRGDPIGAGTAYATHDSRHRMNIRASGLSAFPDRPDDFVRWLGDSGPDDFVPRQRFGAYLADTAQQTGNTVITATVLRLVRRRHGWRVDLDDGTTLESTHAVIATGVEPPSTAWAPRWLLSSQRFIADPWRPGALDAVDDHDEVLIVGTGLTAVDIALTLARTRRLSLVSRHGLLPHTHTDHPAPAYPATSGPADLAGLHRFVRERLATAQTRFGDWRPAIDGLRPITQHLWSSLSLHDRATFLRHDARHWERARHRMAPTVAAAIDEMRRDGRLRVQRPDAGSLPFEAPTVVINATGPEPIAARSRNPLLRHALATGIATPGPVGLGLATDADGRLYGGDGRVVPGLWTLGCLRRGDLYETTAIAEIRGQAIVIAAALARSAHGRSTTMVPVPRFTVVSGTGAEAAAVYRPSIYPTSAGSSSMSTATPSTARSSDR